MSDENILDKITEALNNSTQTGKGIYADCPFCGKQRADGKNPFLIATTDGLLSFYNCFSCGAKGGGSWGLRTLGKLLGVNVSVFRAEAGGGGTILKEATPLATAVQKDEEGALRWPPAWVKETPELTKAGLDYLITRGVEKAAQAVTHHGLYFTSQIETGRGELVDYPAILAPSKNLKGEVLGWSARRLDSLPHDPRQPKVLGMAGEWKKESAFGLFEASKAAPITLVEGLFDALSTPNSVAFGGKGVGREQLRLLAQKGASLYILALDADVQDDKKEGPSAKAKLLTTMLKRDQSVAVVNWELIKKRFGEVSDPGEIGRAGMTEIIKNIEDYLLFRM